LPLDNICANIKRTVSSIVEVQADQRFTVSIEKPQIDVLREGL
jgi:hypothetical protein